MWQIGEKKVAKSDKLVKWNPKSVKKGDKKWQTSKEKPQKVTN